jgi:hypothetical protein
MTLAEADAPAIYVRKVDIDAAVKGREIDVLHALGILWKGGTQHIDCPYPDHGGDGDWRWVGHDAKAFCTCTDGRRGEKTKFHTIFDVIIALEGGSFTDDSGFEAAKIRVAEILGRTDLIRETGKTGKTGTSQPQYIRTDAASLLAPPPSLSRPTLPLAYLAHRLGVEPAAVPIPTTRTAGWAALGYYDPAPSPHEKPVNVGDFPCAIFEMIDAKGRTHAHRIYVEPDGAGKASLGKTAKGEERDPKKSAKKTNVSDIITGHCVVWGDTNKAPHLIGAEGIETAAGIAYAFRPEIDAGEVVVASGINANGLEAIQPWPATQRITVAADRDEAPKRPGGQASLRGGRVGRTLADRLAGRVPVSMALPGQPGQSIDWLDVLRASGPETVRQGIAAAELIDPTAANQEQSKAPRDKPENVSGEGEIWVDPLDFFGDTSLRV